MKRFVNNVRSLAAFIFFSVALSFGANAANRTVASRDAVVEGIKIHYLTAGHGPAVICCMGIPRPRVCGGQSFRFWPRNLP